MKNYKKVIGELFRQFRKDSRFTIQQILKERFEEVYDYKTLQHKNCDPIRDITKGYLSN